MCEKLQIDSEEGEVCTSLAAAATATATCAVRKERARCVKNVRT